MLAFLSIRRFTVTTFAKDAVLKPLKGRPYKNAFEMLSGLPQYGLGATLRRRTWKEDCFYTVTKVQFKDPRHGKVYGIKTWAGVQEEKERRIHGCQKLAAWRFIPSTKTQPNPSSPDSTESAKASN